MAGESWTAGEALANDPVPGYSRLPANLPDDRDARALNDQTDDIRRIALPGLILEFRRRDDRWSHRLIFEPEGTADVRSLDLDSEEPGRVISPTYQELHFHEAGEGPPLAMLVGQAGFHHFSAVFTLKATDRVAMLAVDVADRCREPVLGLAATYVVDLPSGDLRDAESSSIAWEPSIGRGRLVLEAVDPARLAFAEAGRRATKVQATASIDDNARTHRLAYRWLRMG